MNEKEQAQMLADAACELLDQAETTAKAAQFTLGWVCCEEEGGGGPQALTSGDGELPPGPEDEKLTAAKASMKDSARTAMECLWQIDKREARNLWREIKAGEE